MSGDPAGPGHVWVDGRLQPASVTHVSAFDRGFQLGDGIFETLRARSGHPTELPEHVARLRRSAAGLDITLPDDIATRLAGGIAELLVAEGLAGPEGDASIRITVTRGAFRGRGLLPPSGEHVDPTIAIQAWPVVPAPVDHLERGLHLVGSSVRRDPASPLAALKTTSRADYVYARLEARRAGADDALFLTIDDELSEATTANVFLVRRSPVDGVRELATPSLDCAILPGTTRSWLLGWARRVGLRPHEGHLTRAHLLTEYAPGRFGCHDLLRAYAAELAGSVDSEAERRAATGRMLDHYLHTAASAALLLHPTRRPVTLAPLAAGVTPEHIDGVGDALAWFEAERRVLVAAAQRAVEEGFDTHAWQIPWALSRFLDTQGHWHEWTGTEQIALAAAGRLGDRAAQAAAQQRYGYANARLGNYQEAYAHLGLALDIHTERGDHAGQAYVHNALAITLSFQDRYEEALSHARQALESYTAIGDQSGQALALNSVGWFHATLGDHEQALHSCGQALDLFRSLGHQEGVASALDSLGFAHQQGGNCTEAATCYQRAFELHHNIGSRWGAAEALAHLGDARLATGNPAEARVAWAEAFAILDDLNHPDADEIRAKLAKLDAN